MKKKEGFSYPFQTMTRFRPIRFGTIGFLFIPQYIDYGIINQIECDKILVEFLRGNS